MKYSQLSNFQKQQYTNYLETQLQKFSSFMLSQKRENEKYRILEDAIAYQTDGIRQMQAKLQRSELYQKQNQDSFEHLGKKIHRIEDIQARVRRLEDRQRFGCDDQSNLKRQKNKENLQYSNENEEQISSLMRIEKNYKECMKIMRRQQAELQECQSALDKIRKKKSLENLEDHINPETIVDRKDLKRLQKKIVRLINERFEQIDDGKSRRRSKSSKSRSEKRNELSIIDNYAIKQSKNAISSFRMEDEMTNKSQMSTILESKSTKQSKASQRSQKYAKKKRNASKSRSKSKSKKKSESKSISKSKSRKQDKPRKNIKNIKSNQQQSKSKIKTKDKKLNTINKSLSLSDQSSFFSSKSRSKSRIFKHQESKSKDSKLSKHSKHSKHSKKAKKSQSRQKSASNSHDLCKKRPQLSLKIPQKVIQVKREAHPLRKRKPVLLQRYK